MPEWRTPWVAVRRHITVVIHVRGAVEMWVCVRTRLRVKYEWVRLRQSGRSRWILRASFRELPQILLAVVSSLPTNFTDVLHGLLANSPPDDWVAGNDFAGGLIDENEFFGGRHTCRAWFLAAGRKAGRN